MIFRYAGCLVAWLLLASVGRADPPAVPVELKDLPASGFCKIVAGGKSENARFAVAVGFPRPVVDWSKYKDEDREKAGDYYIDTEKEPGVANFLIDLKKDRAVAILQGEHFGTRSSYNHESYKITWSEKASHLVELQSWKWNTAHATLYVLDDQGGVTGCLDLLVLAQAQLAKALQRDHKVDAARFKERYAVSLADPEVNDAGHVSFHAWAEAPKSEVDPLLSLKMEFTARKDAGGKLVISELKVKEEE